MDKEEVYWLYDIRDALLDSVDQVDHFTKKRINESIDAVNVLINRYERKI